MYLCTVFIYARGFFPVLCTQQWLDFHTFTCTNIRPTVYYIKVNVFFFLQWCTVQERTRTRPTEPTEGRVGVRSCTVHHNGSREGGREKEREEERVRQNAQKAPRPVRTYSSKRHLLKPMLKNYSSVPPRRRFLSEEKSLLAAQINNRLPISTLPLNICRL